MGNTTSSQYESDEIYQTQIDNLKSYSSELETKNKKLVSTIKETKKEIEDVIELQHKSSERINELETNNNKLHNEIKNEKFTLAQKNDKIKTLKAINKSL